ncbi:hypothetical protein IC232_21845 [Microvirga sp. BT688]|nr:hypothetical protein [Microvirga sp.]MBD2749326.1 hypothetical protein [Microvirga sp.]
MVAVRMSKRELNRIDILARLDSGRLTARQTVALVRFPSAEARAKLVK